MANTPLGFPFGFYVADNSPIDGKYGIIDAGTWRPYANVAEALATLPAGVRYIGLTVNINKVEYWWELGVSDLDLVVKSGGGGIAWKNPVKAATTANITLSGAQAIDGVALLAGDRVLVKNQITQTENGIYVVASGAWTRATDADSSAELQNAVVSVNEGTINADTSWRQSADGVTVGSGNIIWAALVAGILGSTGSTDNAILRANGTGGATLKNSDLIIINDADLILGIPSTPGMFRTISVDGSSANVGFGIQTKNNGNLGLQAGVGSIFIDAINGGKTAISSGITPTPARLLDVAGDNNTLFDYVLRLSKTRTSPTGFTPGIGVGLEFYAETAHENSEVGATIEAVATDVTAASEDFDLVFKTMAGGAAAAERVRFTSGRIFSMPDGGAGSLKIWPGNSNTQSVFIGGSSTALPTGQTGTGNTGVGANVLRDLTSGAQNTAIGRSVGLAITSGSNNTLLGNNVGDNITTGSNNLLLGFNIDAQSATGNDQLSIQNIIFGTGNSGAGIAVSTGNIGIAVPAPSARLHLPAGTATANTAPLKLTSGTALTTPENGALEYHSSHLYFTIGSTRYQLDQQVGGVSGLTANRIPFATSATTLGDNAGLTWDQTNLALTVNDIKIHLRSAADLIIGRFSGNFAFTGFNNTIIGNNILPALTTGASNVAVGNQIMTINNTGSKNIAVGSFTLNIATGSNNIAIGNAAGDNITSGNSNIIIGTDIDAQLQTASGQLSIQNIIFGTGNTATGTTISTGNVGIAVTAPSARLHLPAGTAAASTAPLKLTTGTALTTPENGALEYHSSHLYFTIGSTRFQLDQQSGVLGGLTTARIPFASSANSLADSPNLIWDNTNNALTVSGARITGNAALFNTFIGISAGNFVATGDNSLGVGRSALEGITSGVRNLAVGGFSGAVLSIGSNNTLLGNNAGRSLTSGSNNTIVGFTSSSTPALTTGNDNTFLGQSAGLLTTGNFNTFLGSSSGDNNTSGGQNVTIGYQVDVQSPTASGQLSIQNVIFGINNTAVGTSVSTGTIGIGVVAPTATLDIAASSTAKSSLRMRSGTAPTTPNDGDIWFDGTSLKIRIGGTTRTFTVT